MRTWKDLHWNWKSFVTAVVIAVVINIFASAVAETKPAKNIMWTVWWIYLTVEAWKYWKWKALLPYPIFLLTSILSTMIMVSVGVDYRGWTDLIVRAALNIGGLIVFYTMFSKSEKAHEMNYPTAKLHKDSISSTNMTHVSENGFPFITTIQEPDRMNQNPEENMESTVLTIAKQTISKAELNEEDFYTQAWDEINDHNRTSNKATWAKAFSISQGDEKKTQAKYVELRVAQLQEEQAVRLLQLKTEQDQACRAKEKARVEAEEKVRGEAERRKADKMARTELQVLARKIQSIGGLDTSGHFIEKLGGSLQEDKIKWFSRIIIVTLWGETHKFSSIPDFVLWVRKDIVPRVLDECQKVEENAT